jgi:hypothetical protein
VTIATQLCLRVTCASLACGCVHNATESIGQPERSIKIQTPTDLSMLSKFEEKKSQLSIVSKSFVTLGETVKVS